MIFLIRWLYRRRRASRPKPNGGRSAIRRDSGTFSLALHQTRYDLVSFLRNGQARFFTLFLPVIFLVIFVSLFGNGTVGPEHAKASTYFVPGIAAMAVISASFVNLVISVVAQREAGVLKRRRAAPVPALALIAGRALTAMVVSLTVLAVVLALGRFAYAVRIPLQALPAVALTAVVGSVAFCVLGYAVSTLIGSSDAAQPIVQATVLPLYFISGVFVPGAELPSWLQHIAQLFPVQHLANGLHDAFGSAGQAGSPAWGDLGVLTLWVAAGLVVALRRFRWTPAAASA
ncbi:MAG TPA: ABC transporter permease [Acidimicrobiales bacterium]|nr:ABC transporter permease [Acidimicrobiales bacterium]